MSAPPEPETSSQVVEVVRDVVTAVSLVGLLLAAGLAIFLARVLPLSWEGTDTRRRLRRLLSYAAGAGAAGFVLQVPVAAVYGQGLELTDVVSAFDAGSVVNELVSAGLVLLGLGMVVRGARVTPPDATERALLLAGALLALAGPSLVGHTRAFAPAPVLVAWDVMHVTAGAVWLGGLVGLVLSLRALAGREVLAAQTLARFSTIAAFALVVVAAAGSFLAWRILGSWAGFVETTYGWLLLTKIGIALVVAAIGGWNRWRTLPAVQAAAGFGDRERAAAAVTRTVRVEAVLLVVLLGVTGFLVNQSPRPVPVTPASGTTGVGGGCRRGPARARGAGPAAYGQQHPPRPGAGLRGRALRPARQPGRVPADRGPRHRRRDVAPGRRRHLPRRGRGAAAGRVGGAGQHPAEPVREPGHDGDVERLTLIRHRVRR